MARYDAGHKEASRDRIVEAARGQFRTRGFDAASIDDLMKAAGLTRGAFYAHFSSKEALVLEVLAIESGLVCQLQSAAAEADNDQAMEVLSAYLSPSQRNDVATNCPLVTHPVDAIRGDADRRAGYTDRVDGLIGALGALPSVGSDDAMLAAIITIGAAQLSAAICDDKLADAIEEVGLGAVHDLIAQ